LIILSITSKSTFKTTKTDSGNTLGYLVGLGILGLMTHAGNEIE